MENQQNEHRGNGALKTIIVVGLVILAVIAAVIIAGNNGGSDGGANTAAPMPTERARVTPTFMYFVSSSDENFADAAPMIAELEAEYGDRIKFDVRNIDEDPESAKNFSVEGQTPALIMLDVYNDISAFAMKCGDKDMLKSYIEAALNK